MINCHVRHKQSQSAAETPNQGGRPGENHTVQYLLHYIGRREGKLDYYKAVDKYFQAFRMLVTMY